MSLRYILVFDIVTKPRIIYHKIVKNVFKSIILAYNRNWLFMFITLSFIMKLDVL